MKNKILKSVMATFALVATLAVMPMASTTVEAAECDDVHCHHETLYLVDYDEEYIFIDYTQHVYVYDATYECADCDFVDKIHTNDIEDHFDPDGDGMCICGTYYY